MMTDLAEIKAFLAERQYRFILLSQGIGVRGIEGQTYPDEPTALKAGLNHWLCEQLGIHWQRLSKYYQLSQFRPSDIFSNEENESIEKAIAWHDELERDEDNEAPNEY